MSDPELNNEEKPPGKEPIFIPKGDGLGWTLNFDRPISYLILVLILAVLVLGISFCSGLIKL